MRGFFRTYWNLVYLLEKVQMEIMKKKLGGNIRNRFYSDLCGKPIWGGWCLRKSCGTLHVWRPYETVEHIWLNIWYMLGWILLQNCRNTLPLHTAYQVVRSAKNETLLYSSKQGIRHRLDGPVSDCKSRCVPIWAIS